MSRRTRTPVRPPGEVGRDDQDAALLADLVATAGRHHPYCAHPETCAGPAVAAVIEETTEAARDRLLLLAVAELAAAPELPGSYDITAAGVAALQKGPDRG